VQAVDERVSDPRTNNAFEGEFRDIFGKAQSRSPARRGYFIKLLDQAMQTFSSLDDSVIRASLRSMPDQFPIFEVAVTKRGRRTWRWHVRTTDGQAIMRGSEKSRSTARYIAYRTLLQLLLTAPIRQRDRA
jgi:hypothetical protein